MVPTSVVDILRLEAAEAAAIGGENSYENGYGNNENGYGNNENGTHC